MMSPEYLKDYKVALDNGVASERRSPHVNQTLSKVVWTV